MTTAKSVCVGRFRSIFIASSIVTQANSRASSFSTTFDSPTHRLVNEFRCGLARPTLILVPPGVWHGVHNIGDPTTVTFRRLGREALDAYLRIDLPYDCAGAAKIESLGIALVERVESDDPTALIGLPLIRLTSMLQAAGVAVLGATT